MLQNAYLLAKIGADTAEKERNVAQILQQNWELPYGSGRVARGVRGEWGPVPRGRRVDAHRRHRSGLELQGLGVN